MIPILFDRYATDFTTNGIGRLYDCVSCTVTEERNGIYELEFQYPITGAYYSYIEHGSIVCATHDDTEDPQPFVVYGHTKPIDGIATFYCSHISYKLNRITVNPFTAASCAAALTGIGTNAINECPFTFWTNKSTEAEFSLAVPTTARSALGGMEGSILDIYGGEYEWDKFTVKLHASRGSNTDVEIRYGKNLVDLTEESDSSGLFDGVVPYWSGETEEGEPILIMLPEEVVTVAGANEDVDLLANQSLVIIQTGTGVDILVDGENIKIIPLDLTDQFEEPPTEADLRAAAQSYVDSAQGWVPLDNLKVDFVQLWQTEEYADYAPLQRVGLCDRVAIYFPELGVARVYQKVVKTVYNVLLDRYDEIELGELQSTLGDVITDSLDLSQFVTGSQLTRLELSIKAITEDLKTQIDSKIETWRQSTDPATNWTTADEKAAHNGDLWCYTGTTTSTLTNLGVYRYGYNASTGVGTWVEYDAAEELFDELDGKTTIYYGTPSGSYPNVNVGDYLVDNTNGSTYRWTGSVWDVQTNYSAAIAAMQSTLEAQIDAKVETWAQATNPAGSWSTAEERAAHNGDLWLYTGTSNITVGNVTIHPQGVYQYNGSTNVWAAYSSTTNNLFDLADGKTTIFYGSPSGTYTGVQNGDYLVDSSTGCTYRWNGSTWVTQTDYQSAINAMQQTLNAAITNATQKITGGLGGYVYMKPNANGYPEEILIMNTADVSTATKVWRWNINGLGYSNHGYNGPYTTAITMDGAIVADFITTGTLNANIIRAGVLSDVGGNTTFDLATGNLNITKGTIDLGSGAFQVSSNGTVAITKGSININNGAFEVDINGRFSADTGYFGQTMIDEDGLIFDDGENIYIKLSRYGVDVYGYDSGGSYTGETEINGTEVSLYDRNLVVDSHGAKMSSANKLASVEAKNTDIVLELNTSVNTKAPNLYMTSTGALRQTSGSSREIKKNIADLKNENISAERLYDLEVVQFKYNRASNLDKEDERFEQLLPGFILEQMDEVYPVAIDKNDSEDPKEWRWNQMYLIPPMVKLIQDQHKEIDELKEELAMIKERISHLEEGKK